MVGLGSPSESKGHSGLTFPGAEASEADLPGTPAFASRQLTFPGGGSSVDGPVPAAANAPDAMAVGEQTERLDDLFRSDGRAPGRRADDSETGSGVGGGRARDEFDIHLRQGSFEPEGLRGSELNQPLSESSKEVPADGEDIADKKKEDFAHFDDSGPEKLARSKAPAGGDQDNTRSAVEEPNVDVLVSSLASGITSSADESAPLSERESLGEAAGSESDEKGFKTKGDAKPGSGSVAMSGRDGVAINSGKRRDRILYNEPTPAPATETWGVKPAENGQPPVITLMVTSSIRKLSRDARR